MRLSNIRNGSNSVFILNNSVSISFIMHITVRLKYLFLSIDLNLSLTKDRRDFCVSESDITDFREGLRIALLDN